MSVRVCPCEHFLLRERMVSMLRAGIQRTLLSLIVLVAAMEQVSSQRDGKVNLTRFECLDLAMADNEPELSEILGPAQTAGALRIPMPPDLLVQMACGPWPDE